VGPFNLDDFDVVDAHVHPPERMTLSESYERWNASFVDAVVPSYDFPGKAALREQLSAAFVRHLYAMPRQVGYNNYMARVHGVAPTIEAFDAVVSRHTGSDAAFSAYIESILTREKISRVVLQSRELAPVAPRTTVPASRFVWTYAIVPLLQPAWARGLGATTIGDVTAAIDRTLETAVSNGCVGFKNGVAYYRPLGIEPVPVREAESALAALLRATPAGHTPEGAPYYDAPEPMRARSQYQDFLLRHVFVKAGALRRPVIVHSAVALHPALRVEFNDPRGLYSVLLDDEVQKAATEFVLIHAGYPSHHVVAAMLSQFPNLYADVSFYAKFPGVLEETLRVFLSLAPSAKVMHGSDSNNVPEEIGYCASNTRQALAKVLREFHETYGWTIADCRVIATNVLGANAARVFRGG
jgi:hypothetical protein